MSGAPTSCLLDDLVRRLEALWVDPAVAPVSDVEQLVEERQRILDALQNADASSLDAAAQRALFARLGAVRARDATLIEALRQRGDEILATFERLIHAREAVRGYRGREEDAPPGVERSA